ncbi:tRNA (guanosine(37)-N1)-methyltransferase TrmD [Mycoplasmatota bacterium zrk1]
MRIDILTIFPNMFTGFLNESIIKRAIQNNHLEINIIDFRTYSKNKHFKVDDYPYGGGQGMVLTPEPIYNAVRDIEGWEKSTKVMMSPQGNKYNQSDAKRYSHKDHLVFLCGHYEGFDERIRDLVDEEMSIGDYVLTGGELASMVIVDSVVRLLDGVLGNELSHEEDSFSDGLLEGPQYTRPVVFEGMEVPKVLLSGHHKNINLFRKKESLKRTYLRRPDLLTGLNDEENILLEEIKLEIKYDKNLDK